MLRAMDTRNAASRRRLMTGLMTVTAIGVLAMPAIAQPRQNLWVELRWVDQSVSGAAMAGVRDGGVVVSTGGSVSARGGVTVSTERREQRQQLFPRVMVLNGREASVTLNEVTPIQWVDVAIDVEPGRRGGGEPRLQAIPRQGVAEHVRSVSVKPSWPGGQQAVTVEVRAQDLPPSGPGVDPALMREGAQLLSTVQAPIGQWVTIARTGQAVTSSSRNSWSTRDAEVQRGRELQLRIDLAP